MDRVVTALRGADGPRHTGVPTSSRKSVVRSLAVRTPNGVDRWQVHHVETHRCDGRQPLGGGAEGTAHGLFARLDDGSLGAGEHLVPGAEEGPLALHDQRQGFGGGDQLPVRAPGERGLHGGREGGGVAQRHRAVLVAHRLGGGQYVLAPVLLGDPGAGPLVELGTFEQGQPGVDARGDLDGGVGLPGADRVAPRLDGVRPPPLGLGGNPSPPTVGAGCQLAHRHGGRSRPLGSRSTTWAATASWPSRNTVAEISKTSSTTALAGLAPQSTAGRTSNTGMRPIMMGSPGGSSRGSVTTAQPEHRLVVHALFALFLAAQKTAGLRAWPLLSAFTRVAGEVVGRGAVRVRGEPCPLSPRSIRALG